MNKAARNERIKITATWFNGAAIAAIAIGCFAPITAFLSATTPIPLRDLNLLVASWLSLSVSLHFAARMTLVRIEE